jgi:hypothetical protein
MNQIKCLFYYFVNIMDNAIGSWKETDEHKHQPTQYL